MTRFAMKKPKPKNNIYIPRTPPSSYTYHTYLGHVPKYLLTHGVPLPADLTMCARMGWWYDFFRELRKIDGLNCSKQESGFRNQTPVVLSIATRVSKLDLPPTEGDKVIGSECKSIW